MEKKSIRQRKTTIKWWGLKGAKQYVSKGKMIIEGKWNLDEDVDKMWNKMANYIKRVAIDVLGESKGCG